MKGKVSNIREIKKKKRHKSHGWQKITLLAFIFVSFFPPLFWFPKFDDNYLIQKTVFSPVFSLSSFMGIEQQWGEFQPNVPKLSNWMAMAVKLKNGSSSKWKSWTPVLDVLDVPRSFQNELNIFSFPNTYRKSEKTVKIAEKLIKAGNCFNGMQHYCKNLAQYWCRESENMDQFLLVSLFDVSTVEKASTYSKHLPLHMHHLMSWDCRLDYFSLNETHGSTMSQGYIKGPYLPELYAKLLENRVDVYSKIRLLSPYPKEFDDVWLVEKPNEVGSLTLKKGLLPTMQKNNEKSAGNSVHAEL